MENLFNRPMHSNIIEHSCKYPQYQKEAVRECFQLVFQTTHCSWPLNCWQYRTEHELHDKIVALV